MSTITDDFKIILQKGKPPSHLPASDLTATHPIFTTGIEGGFAPPTPTARYVITRATKSDVLVISTELRPHGTPRLGPAKTQELKVADHLELITKLQDLLRDLPPQYPGAQDLYGRNISIVHVTDPGAFVDFHRTGSAAGLGVPHPTEEQKVQFDEAVTIIEKLGA
jgi:hypothetical protein